MKFGAQSVARNRLGKMEQPHQTDPSPPVTEEEVLEAQQKWAHAIRSISSAFLSGRDFIGPASAAAAGLYACGHDEVLFKPTKPTKAAECLFRLTGMDAMLYVVRDSNKDAGIAINGSRAWDDCVFDNYQIKIQNGVGFAMGNFYFTSATDGSISTKVEYTCGYMRCGDGDVRIFLHHSSIPYAAKGAAPATEEIDSAPRLLCESREPHKTVGVNAAWTNLCGYTEQEAIGKTPDALLRCDETDRAAASAFAQTLRAHGRASTELVNQAKDGTTFRHHLTGERLGEHLLSETGGVQTCAPATLSLARVRLQRGAN
jgi:PAS domain S-box-containing protein